MRFRKRSCVLLIVSLTLGLACSEIPELLRFADDTSNDFVSSSCTCGPRIYQAIDDHSNSLTRYSSKRKSIQNPGSISSYSPTTLMSGRLLLQLISIQKK